MTRPASKPSFCGCKDATDPREIHKYYKSLGGTVDRDTFGKVVKAVNTEIASILLSGNAVELPFNMGEIVPTKTKVIKEFRDGKLYVNAPVNHKATLQLWKENPKAEKLGRKVYFDTDYIYSLSYRKAGAKYKNRNYYSLTIVDRIRKAFIEKMNSKQIDAYLWKQSQ